MLERTSVTGQVRRPDARGLLLQVANNRHNRVSWRCRSNVHGACLRSPARDRLSRSASRVVDVGDIGILAWCSAEERSRRLAITELRVHRFHGRLSSKPFSFATTIVNPGRVSHKFISYSYLYSLRPGWDGSIEASSRSETPIRGIAHQELSHPCS